MPLLFLLSRPISSNAPGLNLIYQRDLLTNGAHTKVQKNVVFSIKQIKHFVLWFGRPRSTMYVLYEMIAHPVVALGLEASTSVTSTCSWSRCQPARSRVAHLHSTHQLFVRSPRSVPLFYCWLFSSQLTTSLHLTSPRYHPLLTINYYVFVSVYLLIRSICRAVTSRLWSCEFCVFIVIVFLQ